ncbi:hypothetical protein NQ317_017072 [Molorchus minor]|uniref:P/Homo B domain-containing protein n=1 Tax=Molorchus minor TaxID=1323400 RepID=A0ABQ9K503_9CUCU|nr:hypothetical protein NQ317_017072 [Molorchus minor]
MDAKGSFQEVKYLEHVQLQTNINYPMRGALQIYLESPAGTRVQLLSSRKLDKSDKGFVNWIFMSVMTWGELAEGVWVLTVLDMVGPEGNYGNIGETTLILYGTQQIPPHMKDGPRMYDYNYNRIHNGIHASRSASNMYRNHNSYYL